MKFHLLGQLKEIEASGLFKTERIAERMLEKGVYVIGFFYPVVAKGAARIRTQISAAHSTEDLDFAVKMFAEVKQEFGI